MLYESTEKNILSKAYFDMDDVIFKLASIAEDLSRAGENISHIASKCSELHRSALDLQKAMKDEMDRW